MTAKQFIKDYTNHCSNELAYGGFHEWLTPEQAHRAVEIAKDAFIEKACMNLKKLMYDNLMFQERLHREEVIDHFIEDFKNYMNYMKGE